MYRCSACGRATQPGQPRRVHVVQRVVPMMTVVAGEPRETTRTEIARELPVCHGCDHRLTKQRLTWVDLLAVLRMEAAGEPGFTEPPPPPKPPKPKPPAPRPAKVLVRKPVALGRRS